MQHLPSTLDELETEIARLCSNAAADDDIAMAADILEQWNIQDQYDNDKLVTCYTTVLQALVTTSRDAIPDAASRASRLFHKFVSSQVVENWELSPILDALSLVIQVWTATPSEEGASIECQSLLEKFWSLYQSRPMKEQQLSGDEALSLKECYLHTIRACSMRDRGADAAKRAETLIEELEARRADFPLLAPDRRIVNTVMNAWSKSGLSIRAGTKCETLLNNMIDAAESGNSPDMEPDAASFNIVIAALAQGKEK
ncbi:MAG: hypothetical protein SGARI_003870, partial [Bacillariaceae sp.]